MIAASSLLLCLASCQKAESGEAVFDKDTAALENQLHREFPDSGFTFQISTRNQTPDCEAPLCEGYIEDYAAAMQQSADEQCAVLLDCIECCMNNWTVFVTLRVVPKNLCASAFEKQYAKE